LKRQRTFYRIIPLASAYKVLTFTGFVVGFIWHIGLNARDICAIIAEAMPNDDGTVALIERNIQSWLFVVFLFVISEIVEKAIENIPNIYKSITIDKYVIMPNHIHLILIITNDHTDDHGRAMPNRGGRAMRVPTISTVINQMKGYVSKQTENNT